MEDNKGYIELKCPNCGSPLKVREDTEHFYCEYCGTSLLLDRREKTPPRDHLDICDKDKRRLFITRIPEPWTVNRAYADASARTMDWPFTCYGELMDRKGNVLRVVSERSYMEGNSSYDRAMSMYGGVLQGNVKPYERPFPFPALYADYLAQEESKDLGTELRFIEQRHFVSPEEELASSSQIEKTMYEVYGSKVRNELMSRGLSGGVTGVYHRPVLRIYSLRINGNPYRMALYTTLSGYKTRMDSAMMGFGLGSLIGNLFGRKAAAPAGASYGSVTDSETLKYQQMRDMNDQNMMTLEWRAGMTYFLFSPEAQFEEVYSSIFGLFCFGTELDPDIIRERNDFLMKQDMAVNQYTQTQLHNMQMQFEASQRANATVQAAFDSYNRAWFERSNQQFEANRRRSQEMFYGSSGSSGADFSEAIRGVNTYVDQYGREYEVSVRADNAYVKNGDVIGVEGHESPGIDWTKLDRK